jgi:hypothetical protein
MLNDLNSARAIAAIDQTPIPASNVAELVESIVTALVGHAGSFTELVPELHGKPYFDNRDVVYTSALLPAPLLAGINATIDRFDAAPSALNYLDHYYQPSGVLQVPMVMLSHSRDPVAPAFHQLSYRNLVEASGYGDLLVQRTFDRYGHCSTSVPTLAEIGTAFAQLVGWVEFGIKPTP